MSESNQHAIEIAFVAALFWGDDHTRHTLLDALPASALTVPEAASLYRAVAENNVRSPTLAAIAVHPESLPNVTERWIDSLLDHSCGIAGALELARELREAERIRRLRSEVKVMAQVADLPRVDESRILERIESVRRCMAESIAPADTSPGADVILDRALSESVQRAAHPVGIDTLDATRDYSEPDTLLAVCAETSMGKTSLMRQMALAYAESGLSVLYYPLEEPPTKFIRSVVCLKARVPISAYLKKQLSPSESDRIAEAESSIRSLSKSLRVSTLSSVSADDVRRDLLGLPRPCVVFIDHIGNMIHPEGSTFTEQINATSRALRLLSLSGGVSIVEAVQPKTIPDHRDDGRPHVRDLRDSRMLAADASDVLLLWAPSRDPESDSRFLQIAKNRYGPTLTMRLNFARSKGGGFSLESERGERGYDYADARREDAEVGF